MHISPRNGLFGSNRSPRRGNLVCVCFQIPEVSQVSKLVLSGLRERELKRDLKRELKESLKRA